MTRPREDAAPRKPARPLRPCSAGRELFQEQAAPRIPRGAGPRGPNPNAVSAVPVAPPDPTPRRPHMPVLPAPGTASSKGWGRVCDRMSRLGPRFVNEMKRAAARMGAPGAAAPHAADGSLRVLRTPGRDDRPADPGDRVSPLTRADRSPGWGLECELGCGEQAREAEGPGEGGPGAPVSGKGRARVTF